MTRLVRIVSSSAFLLAGCGMHFSEEGRFNHKVHVGETARLWAPPNYKYSFLATQRENCYELQKVMSANDFAGLEKLAKADKVMSTDAGARVKVLKEAYNEREVKLLEGPDEGKTGWVPFEWLKPLQPGDH